MRPGICGSKIVYETDNGKVVLLKDGVTVCARIDDRDFVHDMAKRLTELTKILECRHVTQGYRIGGGIP